MERRLEAAAKLDKAQKSRLKSLLEAELCDNFDVRTREAIWMLGEIGDGESLEVLLAFCHRPREGYIPGKIGYALHRSIDKNLKRKWAGKPSSLALETAKDSTAYLEERLEAASHLDEKDRARLRAAILAELPGKWDRSTSQALWVLHSVVDADADALRKLEKLEEICPASKKGLHDRLVRVARSFESRVQEREATERSKESPRGNDSKSVRP